MTTRKQANVAQDIRTEIEPAYPQGSDQVRQVEQADGEPEEPVVLGPNQLCLSDGRVVDIKRTRGPHDERVDQLLSRCGYRLDGMGPLIYGRYRALLAVESIDGEYQLFPRTKEQLHARLDYDTEDIEAISTKYAKINGLVKSGTDDEDGADFR